MIPPIFLHSPGCNDPNELCAPHPSGLSSIFNADFLTFVALGVVALAVLVVYVFQRYYPHYGGSNE